jgi:hypothetical protein
VFNIDIETCHHCGGEVKVIACIADLPGRNLPVLPKHMMCSSGKVYLARY